MGFGSAGTEEIGGWEGLDSGNRSNTVGAAQEAKAVIRRADIKST